MEFQQVARRTRFPIEKHLQNGYSTYLQFYRTSKENEKTFAKLLRDYFKCCDASLYGKNSFILKKVYVNLICYN